MEVHPDKNPGDATAKAQFQVLVTAKEALLWRKRCKAQPPAPNVPRMGFGKYRNLSIDTVLRQDADYCRWVVDTYNTKNDCEERMKVAAKWILGNSEVTMKMGFGSYRDQAMDWVIEHDPRYTEWAVRTWKLTGHKSGLRLSAFAKYAAEKLHM